MNCESWFDPKKARTTAEIGLEFTSVAEIEVVALAGGHPVLDDADHPREPRGQLVLEKLADRAHAPIAEVVDVVDAALALEDVEERLDRRDEVDPRQADGVERDVLVADARAAC